MVPYFEQLFSGEEDEMQVYVVTCSSEGCEECGHTYHVVGVRATKEQAKALGREHESDKSAHLHYFCTEVTEAEVAL